MNKVLFYIEKYKIYIVLIFIILVLISIIILNTNKSKEEVIINNLTEDIEDTETIKVDIKGMIVNSGVYELNNNSRVIDVIELAGGLIEGANTDYLNLSKKLKDGDVIIVYSDEYINSLKKENIVYIELPCECPDNINTACIDNIVNEEVTNKKDELISINSASKEELMTLPGVGESKADAIIKYRNDNNGFSKLEDIMNVSGIGEAAYTKIKDYIKL